MGRVSGADAWGLRPHVRAWRGALARPDRWTSFVDRAYLRLHLDIYYRRILQDRDMPVPVIKRPMELVGLKGRLQRAQMSEKAIEVTGKRYDKVLDEIDDLRAAADMHVGDLEAYKGDLANTISRMIGGSNGGDPLDESDGQDSAGVKVPAAADTVKPDIMQIAAVDVAPTPEPLKAPDPMPPASAGR